MSCDMIVSFDVDVGIVEIDFLIIVFISQIIMRRNFTFTYVLKLIWCNILLFSWRWHSGVGLLSIVFISKIIHRKRHFHIQKFTFFFCWSWDGQKFGNKCVLLIIFVYNYVCYLYSIAVLRHFFLSIIGTTSICDIVIVVCPIIFLYFGLEN